MSGEPSGKDFVLIEMLDASGWVLLRERVALGPGKRTVSIGRSAAADVVLDDEHVAALHAAVEVTPDGRLLASDLGSLNGIIAAGARHHGGQGLVLTDGMLQVGRTRLRLRTPAEVLAPERPLRASLGGWQREPAWLAGGAAVVGVGQLVYASWLGAPRDLAVDAVNALGMGAGAVAAWVALWALLSRIMQNEWRWLRHAAIAIGISVIFNVLRGLHDLGGFMLSLPQSSALLATLVTAIAVGCLLYLHLIHASNLTAKRAALAACIVPALLAGGSHWLTTRGQLRDVNRIEVKQRIYPPTLRLREARPVAEMFAAAPDLRAAADAKRRNVPSDEPGD